jgi:hypothetical protein
VKRATHDAAASAHAAKRRADAKKRAKHQALKDAVVEAALARHAGGGHAAVKHRQDRLDHVCAALDAFERGTG